MTGRESDRPIDVVLTTELDDVREELEKAGFSRDYNFFLLWLSSFGLLPLTLGFVLIVFGAGIGVAALIAATAPVIALVRAIRSSRRVKHLTQIEQDLFDELKSVRSANEV